MSFVGTGRGGDVEGGGTDPIWGGVRLFLGQKKHSWSVSDSTVMCRFWIALVFRSSSDYIFRVLYGLKKFTFVLDQSLLKESNTPSEKPYLLLVNQSVYHVSRLFTPPQRCGGL